MKRTALLYISLNLMLGINLFAQGWSLKLSSNVEIRTWKLTSTYEKEEKSLGGAKIVLTKGSEIVTQTTTDGGGDFTVEVPPDGDYLLTVSYPGFNTKRFAVNTKNVPAELAKDDYKPTFSIGGFIMARAYPGIDYSGLEQPLVKVEFKPKRKLFDHDDLVTENGLNIVTKIYTSENALIQKFCSTNKAGDVALAKPDCPLAKKLYQEAQAMIPFETYPVIQLQKVGDCLKNQSEAQAKAAEEAAKKAAAEKAAAEKALADAAAKAKLDADKAAAQKLAADEKAAANAAAKAKSDADKAAAEKLAAETAAKEKEARSKENSAKAQAAAQNAAQAEADKKAEVEKKKKEGLAKSKEEDAKAIRDAEEKKANKLAKQKEGEAKAKAADEAEAKAIADKKESERLAKEEDEKRRKAEAKTSDGGEMDKGNSKYSVPQVLGPNKYKETIKRADDLFKMKRWAEAKVAYDEALSYKADDAYAKQKLEIVNKNLAPK